MSNLSITVVILTFNEEIHLQRCLNNVFAFTNSVIIVDSFSTDKTKEIALKNNVKFVQNPWVNYATQFNWALSNVQIKTDWILRLDADEYLTQELINELKTKVPNINQQVNGIIFPLNRIFLGRHIKKGLGTIKMLRLFRTGFGRSENRWMDEHIKLISGETRECEHPFTDDNLNNISWWTNKHVSYAIREAIDLLDIELNLFNIQDSGRISSQANTKRQLKLKYAKKPLFIRSFIYFLYRYFFKLGFTEGKEGFLWHFLQGWWYRTLVDVKIYEIKKACGTDKIKIKNYLKAQYSINI